MKIFLMILLCLLIVSSLFSQPKSDFESLFLQAEKNPKISIIAKKHAIERNLPLSIYTQEKVFIYPLIFKNDKVLYAVIKDITHPILDGILADFDEIEKQFEVAKIGSR